MPRAACRRLVVLAPLLALPGCGSAKPPAGPSVTATAVAVGVTGNASASLAPGETRQLVATASRSNGSTLDVTNLATWQSSAASVATVSPSGLLMAAAEGSVDVTATYNSVKGTWHADIRPTCTITVSPQAALYTAFGGSTTVNVAVDSASCRWSARSDAAWFPFVFEPANPGHGSFSYTLPPNSTTEARATALTIETSTGQRATHSITEDKPLGCSYVTDPAEIVFTASGGTGQFTVHATPGDCQWNMVNGMSALGVSVTTGFSGRDGTLVRYSVQAHTRSVDADGYLEIAGQSGLNPNGRHHVVILRR